MPIKGTSLPRQPVSAIGCLNMENIILAKLMVNIGDKND